MHTNKRALFLRILLTLLLVFCLPFPLHATPTDLLDPGEYQEEEDTDLAAPTPSPAFKRDKNAEKQKPAAPEPAPAPATPEDAAINTVILRGLNKVTARISTLEIPLGTASRFGNLDIIPKRCWKAPPESRPENAALIEIWETKPSESPQKIFSGWMFSSSPAISTLAHPVYDVTVMECVYREGM